MASSSTSIETHCSNVASCRIRMWFTLDFNDVLFRSGRVHVIPHELGVLELAKDSNTVAGLEKLKRAGV